jgi:hypothetical protein
MSQQAALAALEAIFQTEEDHQYIALLLVIAAYAAVRRIEQSRGMTEFRVVIRMRKICF